MTHTAINKHLELVKKNYGNCLAVNLLSVKKYGENKLIKSFESLIKQNKP